jgi:predicted dehydrogenase
MTAMTRRHFLAGSMSTAALGLGTLTTSRGAAPSEQVVVAVVGVNGMGNFHVGTLMARSDVRLAYLCDVDDRVAARVGARVEKATGKRPRLVRDFKQVLDDKAVDALVIATPHHWHCPIAIPALQAGKDVYVEKPASHVFHEGQLLVEAARKYKRIVQHGTQMRSSEVTEAAGKVLASGLLGAVKTTKAWNVQKQPTLQPRPDAPVPPGVDYDRWLGPAAKRPFNPNRFHRTWRLYRDYGNGDIGDDGIHDLDMARWGLGVTTHPVRITAHGSRIHLEGEREFPDNMMVTYQYAEGKVLIYEDRQWTPYGMHGFDSGNAFYGTEGYMIFSRRGYFQVYLGREEKKGPGMGERGRVGQPAPQHMANFLECVRSRKQTNAPPEVAHLSCALTHLGDIAYRTGKVLHFDPKKETFLACPEANALLTKEYRKPWTLPDRV